MTTQKKLFFTCEYYAHLDKYRPWNKIAFWKTIWKFLKEYIEYNLLELKLTVIYWVKAHIDKLVKEEMGSDT